MTRDTGLSAAILAPITVRQPTAIAFGPGAVSNVATHVAAKNYRRPLIVASRFNATRIDVLGLPHTTTVFGSAKAEPDLPNLDALLAMAEATQPDVIIGFGGGSTLDLAKLAAGLLGSGQRFLDVVGPNKLTGRRCGLVQVATTAGTGSEVGTRALVTDPATTAKLAVDSPFMLADLAVVDPDLTMSVPPDVTAATGVDAMAHCVEAFTNKKAHPIIDGYALEGIRLVGRYLARAVADGTDREARAGLSLASLYGGFCLGPVNTAGGHALAYPLGTRHRIAHGAANAMIFPHVLAFNADIAPEKTALILAALGLAGRDVLAATYDYCEKLGIEMRLSRAGVPEHDIEQMATDAFAIRRLLDNNPREISREEIVAIYRAAF